LKERCEIFAKQLEEAQVVGYLRKQRTTTFQERVTSPRELEWKGKGRIRISVISKYIRSLVDVLKAKIKTHLFSSAFLS